MNATYLKFPDEATGRQVLRAAGVLVTLEGEELTAPGYFVALVGALRRATGSTTNTPDGPQAETVAVAGWHVNVYEGSLSPEVLAYAVTVVSPRSVRA